MPGCFSPRSGVSRSLRVIEGERIQLPARATGVPSSRRKGRSNDALHVGDQVVAERGALDLRGPFHEAREIIGHALAANRAV